MPRETLESAPLRHGTGLDQAAGPQLHVSGIFIVVLEVALVVENCLPILVVVRWLPACARGVGDRLIAAFSVTCIMSALIPTPLGLASYFSGSWYGGSPTCNTYQVTSLWCNLSALALLAYICVNGHFAVSRLLGFRIEAHPAKSCCSAVGLDKPGCPHQAEDYDHHQVVRLEEEDDDKDDDGITGPIPNRLGCTTAACGNSHDDIIHSPSERIKRSLPITAESQTKDRCETDGISTHAGLDNSHKSGHLGTSGSLFKSSKLEFLSYGEAHNTAHSDSKNYEITGSDEVGDDLSSRSGVQRDDLYTEVSRTTCRQDGESTHHLSSATVADVPLPARCANACYPDTQRNRQQYNTPPSHPHPHPHPSSTHCCYCTHHTDPQIHPGGVSSSTCLASGNKLIYENSTYLYTHSLVSNHNNHNHNHNHNPTTQASSHTDNHHHHHNQHIHHHHNHPSASDDTIDGCSRSLPPPPPPPLPPRLFRSRDFVSIGLFFLYSATLTISSLPVIGFGPQHEPIEKICSSWLVPTPSTTKERAFFVAFLTCVYLCLLVGGLTAARVGVLVNRRIKQEMRRTTRLYHQEQNVPDIREFSILADLKRHYSLTCLALCGILTWLPMAVMLTLQKSGVHVSEATLVYSNIATSLPCLLNPLLYSLVLARYREGYKAILEKCCRKGKKHSQHNHRMRSVGSRSHDSDVITEIVTSTSGHGCIHGRPNPTFESYCGLGDEDDDEDILIDDDIDNNGDEADEADDDDDEDFDRYFQTGHNGEAVTSLGAAKLSEKTPLQITTCTHVTSKLAGKPHDVRAAGLGNKRHWAFPTNLQSNEDQECLLPNEIVCRQENETML